MLLIFKGEVMMERQGIQDNLISIGKLFENYRRINQDKLRQGYPQELKKRVLFLLKNGADKNELIHVTKISPPTLSTWISQYEDEEVELPAPKELKITADHSDIKVKDPSLNKITDKYCAKINVNNGMSIELTEQGLILSLNTL